MKNNNYNTALTIQNYRLRASDGNITDQSSSWLVFIPTAHHLYAPVCTGIKHL
jgi:hypothetical protein